MKRFFTVFLPLMLVLALFFACSSEEATFQKTAVENVRIAISNVSASGATVTIWDTNETPYLYGSWYEIEKKDNGQWHKVQTVIDHYAFDAMGHIPDETGKVEFAINWEWLYGKLPSGEYRLLKNVNSAQISVEFTVN